MVPDINKQAGYKKHTCQNRSPTLRTTIATMMESVDMSLVAPEIAAKTNRIMLKGWKKAFHKIHHHAALDL
jgi:hypothetical protein